MAQVIGESHWRKSLAQAGGELLYAKRGSGILLVDNFLVKISNQRVGCDICNGPLIRNFHQGYLFTKLLYY
jgi:hypothetical protein